MKRAIAFIAILCLLSGPAFSWSEGQEVRVFKLNYRQAGDLYPIAMQLKSDEGKVTPDTKANSLIVVDYPANLERIAGIIGQLDKAEKQVQIKVVVADVGDAAFNEIGMAAGQVVIPRERIKAVMGLVSASRDSKIRSEMMVTASSNQPANIQVTADQVYGGAVIRDQSGTETVEALRQKVGEVLEVLPIVNENGTILVTLRPSSSAVRKDGAIYEKSSLTQVAINSGDTIAIGDADSTKQNSVSATPMFERASASHKRVVMFLTATIRD